MSSMGNSTSSASRANFCRPSTIFREQPLFGLLLQQVNRGTELQVCVSLNRRHGEVLQLIDKSSNLDRGIFVIHRQHTHGRGLYAHSYEGQMWETWRPPTWRATLLCSRTPMNIVEWGSSNRITNPKMYLPIDVLGLFPDTLVPICNRAKHCLVDMPSWHDLLNPIRLV